MMDKISKIKKTNSWHDVLWISVPLIIYFGLYHSFVSVNFISVRELLIKGVTHTGLILIALSLLLGNLAKFWNTFDKYLHYRKQLGIIGFYYVFFHGNIATILYLWSDPSVFRNNIISFLAGLISIYVLGVCVEVSEIWVIRKLGSKLWRKTIRYLSYSAFILALVHIALIRWSDWTIYLQNFSEGIAVGKVIFPQLSFITFVLSSGVVLFRFGVAIYDFFVNIEKNQKL